MKIRLLLVTLAIVVATHTGRAQAPRPLQVYWIDVEGGAATLIVTPAGESVLVDAGNPGGRDSGRVLKTAKEVAHLTRIDDLVVTHLHGDHFGGVAEVASGIPVGTLNENGISNAPAGEQAQPTLARVSRREGGAPRRRAAGRLDSAEAGRSRPRVASHPRRSADAGARVGCPPAEHGDLSDRDREARRSIRQREQHRDGARARRLPPVPGRRHHGRSYTVKVPATGHSRTYTTRNG